MEQTQRYRAIFTFEAASREAALLLVLNLDRMPRNSSMRLENDTRRRLIWTAVILGLVYAALIFILATILRTGMAS